jgi:hypothetical protein
MEELHEDGLKGYGEKIKKRYLELVNAKNRSNKEEKVGNVHCGT